MGQKASTAAAKAPKAGAAAAAAAEPPPVKRTWFATVQCSICLEDVVLSASISCKNKHSCCKDCFAQYVQSTVENPGKLLDSDFNVPCPTPQCSACPWTHAELGTHLTKDQMNSFYDSIISISKNILNHTEQDGGGGIKRNIVKGIIESKLEEAVLSALNLSCPKCTIAEEPEAEAAADPAANGDKAAKIQPKEAAKNPKEELIKRVLKKVEPILKDINILPHEVIGGNAPTVPVRGKILGAAAGQYDYKMLFLDLFAGQNSSAIEYGVAGAKCLLNQSQSGCASDGTTVFVSFSNFSVPGKEENGGETGAVAYGDSTGYSIIDVTGFKVGDQNFVRLSNGMFTNAADLEIVNGHSNTTSSTTTRRWNYSFVSGIGERLKAAVSRLLHYIWVGGRFLVLIGFKGGLLVAGWFLLALVMKQIDMATDICKRLFRCTGNVNITRWRMELKPTEESKLAKGMEVSAVSLCALYIMFNYLW